MKQNIKASELDSILEGYHTESMMNIDRRNRKKCFYSYCGPIEAYFTFNEDLLYHIIDDEETEEELSYEYNINGKNDYYVDKSCGIRNEFENDLENIMEDIKDNLPEKLKNIITDIWYMYTDRDGDNYYIGIKTKYELTEKEKEQLQNYIDGQMSDGVGEGFEQEPYSDSEYVTIIGEDIDIDIYVSLWSQNRESKLEKVDIEK